MLSLGGGRFGPPLNTPLIICNALRVACLLIVARKLHCPRNTVHVNLFISFILRCVMALTRDLLMADSVGLRDDTVAYDDDDGFFFSNSTSVTLCFVIFSLLPSSQ